MKLDVNLKIMLQFQLYIAKKKFYYGFSFKKKNIQKNVCYNLKLNYPFMCLIYCFLAFFARYLQDILKNNLNITRKNLFLCS